ncbi:SDR family oxidoreductase [Maritimibacter alkaliphilus]|uniref:SDR family oxidoreductase n=1 Tax=Maritimibacter alkaliphilus TaxID=404236 RepID=UPI001C985968|nr:SDR family oxidoreductase [Maritimibacter alkaliphilus]MBY6092601.1 SDR family oxidoreductase [Maritimibacter alkaliphilus]
MAKKKLLLFGATGVIGQAALRHFRSLDGWTVVPVSRRVPEGERQALSLDLLDEAACAETLGALTDITHVLYAAVYEKPGALIEGWRDPEQMANNDRMLRNVMGPLLASGSPLEHVTLFQGSKAYGSHIETQVPIPAKERWPRHDHRNFYWLQEDYLRECQQGADWAFTVLRPRIVFGGAFGSNMNPISAIGVYAAIQREKGEPLHYPGGPARINQAVDADLIARACAWAATSPNGRNEIFNIDNGDLFVWQTVWPRICEALDMPMGEARPMFLDTLLEEGAETWAAIVDRHGLKAPREIGRVVGQSLGYTDWQMSTGKEVAPNPVIASTIKIRQAGFADCIDTEDMFAKWFEHYRREGYLP